MARYVGRRALQGLLVLWGVTLVVFLVIHLIPGDPGRSVLGSRVSAEAVARLDHQLGIDRSLPVQYVDYLKDLVRGDFGSSITEHTSVGSLVAPRLLPSLALVGYAIGISLLLAIPLALLTATRVNLPTDHVVRTTTVVLYAIPSFWFGLMMAVVFGLELHLFPTSGFDGSFPGGLLQTLTLPATTVALFVFPVLMRLLRSSTIETLRSEFVDAARARGLGGARVLVRHVLRNSLTSSVTFIGASIGTLLSIALVVEQVFAIPGLGSLLVSSVLARDYPTVQGLTFIFALVVVLGNFAADVLYVVLDPRVRL